MLKDIRKTLYIAIPIILGNLTQVILNLIDNAMVGAIHSTQLAASSLVINIIAIPMVAGIGLTMAISPLVAAASGEGNKSKPMGILYNAFWVSFLISSVLAIALCLGRDIVYHLKQDPEVAELAETYLIWMACSMVPMTMFLAVKHFADGLEKTKWPLILSFVALPLNVLLNYIFIFGKAGAPRMELDGAGVGSLLSRVFLFLAMTWIVLKWESFAEYREDLKNQLKLKKEHIRQVLKLGVPTALQFGMEVGAFAIGGIFVGWFGSEQQAAHQIALGLASMTFMVSLGLSSAGSIRVGNAFGRAAMDDAKYSGKNILLLSTAYGIFCGILFVIFNSSLPYIFNSEPEVVSYAATLLLFAALFQISDSVQAIAVGLLRGLQDVNIPTWIVAVSYWVVGIPACLLFAFTFEMESKGIWLGFVIGLTFSALLNTRRFFILTNSKQSTGLEALKK